MRIPERARLGVAARIVAGCAVGGCAVAGGMAAGCMGKSEPVVTIATVSPATAFSGAQISFRIQGGPFRPVYDIDTGTGRATLQPGAFTAFLSPADGNAALRPVPAVSLTWVNTNELAAVLPADIAAGSYDVDVRDPRGGLARLPAGFLALGDDRAPPSVSIDEPQGATIVNAGAEVPVAYEADDGAGHLESMGWIISTSDIQRSGTCPLGPNLQRATCRFVFVVPRPMQLGQPLNVDVFALDTSNNVAHAQTTLAIGLSPVVDGFSPFQGPAAGGTAISVSGDNFISGTQVFVGGALLQPNGGAIMSAHLIQGTTAAHDPGVVTLTVRTGSVSVDAPDDFTFVGRPEVRGITPGSGPLAGCTPVAIVGKYFRDVTSIWFGSDATGGSPLLCVSHVGPNRIEGFTPPGAGVVSVFAGDLVSGVGQLPLAFTYLDVDAPDAGSPAPSACDACAGGAP
jgi:hypothetical protein